MKPLVALLPSLLRQSKARDRFTEQATLALWEAIVGETLACRTRPVSLRQSRLVVLVPSLTWKRQLRSFQRNIMTQLNQALGTSISSMEFRIDPTLDQPQQKNAPAPRRRSSPHAELSLRGIEDDELRACIQAAASTCLDRPE